ncbi:DMT family transporter [Isorropodon fossajaponicum symbiont]|uniref:DMT family transporter n=1 Tax=Isorropodon fossajaponicum symbiont TaxID=883811 RepID=UPI0019152FF0|nr:DMT family transporter [Isorropodon fossajaponicum symbiont]
MQIILVFLSVVAIWSTTPLAIVWSALGSSFNFSVASRMLIGLIICLLLLRIKKQKLTLTRLAIRHYLHTGAGIFITMSLVYYASQSISSGALIISTPLFILSWLLTGDDIPEITSRAGFSIIYLALFGSVIGFMSYYYLIRHACIQMVVIVPLITSIFALLLGSTLNHETLTNVQLSGIILVLIGLGVYEYGGKVLWIKK